MISTFKRYPAPFINKRLLSGFSHSCFKNLTITLRKRGEIVLNTVLNDQIFKAGNIYNDRVAFANVFGNKNTVPEDNRPVTSILNEIYDYINEDLSVLPNPAGPDTLSRTPNEIKTYLNPAGLKHLASLTNEVFLLKNDKLVDQIWTDGIYYTGHDENFGTVIVHDIMPKEDKNNPYPDDVINHYQHYADATCDWHISGHNRTDTNTDTDVIADHHGRISIFTKNRNKPLIDPDDRLLNDDYERTESIMSTMEATESIATMDANKDGTALVSNNIKRTYVKVGVHQSHLARSIDNYARILQDGKIGRSWLLDTRDNLKYYNQLTLRLKVNTLADKTQLKEPQTIARIIDIPVHIMDLEDKHVTTPNTHGSKDMDDTNFDFYLPYSKEKDGSPYLGVENREKATVDDYYCKKNDFNWFWNHYNNKMKYIDYDRNQLWTAINRLRNSGHFLGYVYEYSQSRDTSVPNNTPNYSEDGRNHTNNFPDYALIGQQETRGSTSVPAYSTTKSNLRAILEGNPSIITRDNPGITTWDKLRSILSCDENRVVFDNDFFIVQHNNDSTTFEPYDRETGRFKSDMFNESNYVRLDYEYAIANYGSVENYINTYYAAGSGTAKPSTSQLQNVITNRYGSTDPAQGNISIRQTKQWEDTLSQMGDFYTYKARVYRIMNLDENQYRKDGNDGRPGDIRIAIYPDTYLDQTGRVFCDPQQPLGRGRIKTLEIEDNAVTFEKLEISLQYLFRQQLRPWFFYDKSSNPPCGTVTKEWHDAHPTEWPNALHNFPGIYDYRSPGNNPLYTSPSSQGGTNLGRLGCNIAVNLYTRVCWVCCTDYSPTKTATDSTFGHIANMGAGVWVPLAGTIYP